MSVGENLLLLFTLILQIVDRGAVKSKCMGKMPNDLKIICLAYCMIINWILKEQQAFKKIMLAPAQVP